MLYSYCFGRNFPNSKSMLSMKLPILGKNLFSHMYVSKQITNLKYETKSRQNINYINDELVCRQQFVTITLLMLVDEIINESPNHFHLLPRVFGINSQVIFYPFPLFPLSGRDSSTNFFRVPLPVVPHHPLTSGFVMSAHPHMRFRSDRQTHPTAWLTRSS